MLNKTFKVFIDFDGTITLQDIGDSIFRKFGNPEFAEETISKLLNGEITAKQSWTLLNSGLSVLNKTDVDEFIDSFVIDDSFVDFISFLNSNGISPFVLSDGFDYYINRIFLKYNISGIKYFANNFRLENGIIKLAFPFYNADFPTSANCKRDHIINNSADSDYTVYIGDGNSDKFAAPFCDFIFAKKKLKTFCEKEKITFFPFYSFSDVKVKMETLINKKNLKKSNRAVQLRKAAYKME